MARESLTNQVYLSQIYFKDHKLRRFALSEFERCLRSGRMTAFVGSMVTEGLGYPNWTKLLDMGKQAVLKVLEDMDPAGFAAASERFENGPWPWLEKEMKHGPAHDGRVVSSVIGHWIDNETRDRRAGERINFELARLLIEGKMGGPAPLEEPAAARVILKRLIEDLQIRRFITTNYDMEIEYTLADIVGKTVQGRFNALTQRDKQFITSDEKQASCQRIFLDNGLVIASDAFHRDRLDCLIEFSVGTSEIDFHVMHLHGRIDKPATMVVSYRDYDRLYRHAGVSKAPFDQALAMLHSSNPVLFVGLGMSEPELNAALQDIVGNQPFKGVGRRFLLWSVPKPILQNGQIVMTAEDLRQAFRIEKLHKLGVLTIFDDEVKALLSESESAPADATGACIVQASGPPDEKAIRCGKLADMLGRLAERSATKQALRQTPIDIRGWRDLDFRGDKAKAPIVFTWHFTRELDHAALSQGSGGCDARATMRDSAMVIKTSRPGTSKGTTATSMAINWAYRMQDGALEQRPGHFVFFANMSLRLDTDSILESLYLFLHHRSCEKVNGHKDRRDLKHSREREFRAGKGAIFHAAPNVQPLIIFKGLERIFSKKGIPLSAEMDHFFRSYISAALIALHGSRSDEGKRLASLCRIMVFGTRRMRIYFRMLEDQVRKEIARLDPGKDAEELAGLCQRILTVSRIDDEPSGYLRRMRALYSCDDADMTDKQRADDDYPESLHGDMPPTALAGDRSYARETYRQIFASKRFRDSFPGEEQKKAFAILTVMAFVGQPVEAEVLVHAPRVRKAFSDETSIIGINDMLSRLADKRVGLVRTISRPDLGTGQVSTSAYYRPRYALHMTLQAEFRERYGVPLSEAALSTSFNMSLYVAQPADAAISDPHVHDELGKLIDWFIGAHRDRVDMTGPLPDTPDMTVAQRKEERSRRRARPHVAAALRAALAILRGFYSTSALLSLDLGEHIVDDHRDGVLTEHANRIERLIRAFDKQAKARIREGEKLDEDGQKRSDKQSREERFREEFGPGAIYRDELVWLHNERGVVKLAQGDLYEARYSFNEADRINREEVEYSCRSHNWRRIWLNQVMVDLERGKLVEAADRIGRIENSLPQRGLADDIRTALTSDKAGARSELPLLVSHEDCLAIALTTGYSAVLKFLRGEINSADRAFVQAVEMLERLGEQRACALFRRYHATLLFTNDRKTEAGAVAHLAICGAESVQQMDIAYRARIVRQQEFLESPSAEERRHAMTTFNKAIAFANEADVHRVAVEAHGYLALLKLHGGDLEGALEHASIATALAARYGLSLEKIRLRIVLGEILHKRGTIEAATSLIRNAINQAERIGYQRTVEAAQIALLKMALA